MRCANIFELAWQGNLCLADVQQILQLTDGVPCPLMIQAWRYCRPHAIHSQEVPKQEF